VQDDNKPKDLEEMLAALGILTEQIGASRITADAKVSKRIRTKLEHIAKQLNEAAVVLDPILRPLSIFDPTDPVTSGRVIALTLVAQARHSLAAIPEFYGAGVYALYYKGPFEAYRSLAGTDHPIYVGKADPGHDAAKDAITQGQKLSARLREHGKSIGKASNLNLSDFECRFLIVQTGFQKAAEEYLIKFFRPIWNSETKICFGLGKHGDSSSTRGNKRSPWDTMHPGRLWAMSTADDQKTIAAITTEIAAHLLKVPPFADKSAILDRFFDDMRQMNTDQFFSPIAGEVAID
jgi:hypothetical protein